MSDRYKRVWHVPGAPGQSGILLACGSEDKPEWWVLCPATATLYDDEVVDGEGACSNFECDWDEIHTAARKLWEQITEERAT